MENGSSLSEETLNPNETPNALKLTDRKQTQMNLDRQAGAVCCTVAPVHVCACSAAAPEAMECAASLFPAALTSRCLSEPAAAFVPAGASRPLLLSCRETKHVLLFFVFFLNFNSCSVGGESSLMCKKYVSGVSSLSLNSPRKVHPSLLLPLGLYPETCGSGH